MMTSLTPARRPENLSVRREPLLEILEQFAAARLKARVGATALRADLRFPDSSVDELVGALARLDRIPVREVLHDFGQFIAVTLLLPRAARQPAWHTLEVLAHLNDILSAGGGTLRLPANSVRTGVDEILLSYARGRHWCELTRGLAEAVAEHFGEHVEFTEPSCLNRRSAPQCRLFIRRVAVKRENSQSACA